MKRDVNAANMPLPPHYAVMVTSNADATALRYIPSLIMNAREGRYAVPAMGAHNLWYGYDTLDEARMACWLHYEAFVLGISRQHQEWMQPQPQQGGQRRVG